VTVILDPGHGGTDSGYRRRDCREDALNYRFTATLSRVLRASGARVLFTIRSAALDVSLTEGKPEPPLLVPRDAVLAFNRVPVTGSIDSLHQRAAFVRLPYLRLAPEKKATARGLYFLAIHHDAYYIRSVRGGHVLYDRRDGGPPPFAHILARRLSAASLARKPYAGRLPPSDARHLGVLNPLYNPVPQRALLEVATISNAQDRDNALSRQWRWRFAHLIADAIAECEKGPR
jgi:N-acetylmuramoyl-L-alanine amidase